MYHIPCIKLHFKKSFIISYLSFQFLYFNLFLHFIPSNTLVYIYIYVYAITRKILFRIFDLRRKMRNFIDNSFIIREIN